MKSKPRKIASGIHGKITALRHELKLTKQQMADSLGLKYSGYARYERGQSIPGLHTLSTIVDKYRLSVDWLIFDRGPKYIEDRGQTAKLGKEVEQLKTKLDCQQKDFDTRLAQESKKVETLEQQLEQKEAISHNGLSKPGIRDLLDLVEENPVFYYKLMLYFEGFKKEIPTTN